MPKIIRDSIRAIAILTLTLLLPAVDLAAATIFADEFEGSALDPRWETPGSSRWVDSYSVTGGKLRYWLSGPSSPHGNESSVALILQVLFTGTEWQADTKVSYWLRLYPEVGPPPDAPPLPGNQEPMFGVHVRDWPLPPQQNYFEYSEYIHFRPYTSPDSYGTVRQSAMMLGSWVSAIGPSSPVVLSPTDTYRDGVRTAEYWLRFIRSGAVVTALYSHDGISYAAVNSFQLGDPSNTANMLVITGHTTLTVGSYADYDYVRVTSLEGVPEPGTTGLIAGGLVLLMLARRYTARMARLRSPAR